MDLEDVMLIYKALLAHGFSNFTALQPPSAAAAASGALEILEYCEPDKNIESP